MVLVSHLWKPIPGYLDHFLIRSNTMSNEMNMNAKSLISAKIAELTPVQKSGAVGAIGGAAVGGAIGGAIGATVGLVWQHKGKVAIAAAAVAAFVYRGEIADFVTGVTGGESAGGDAFM